MKTIYKILLAIIVINGNGVKNKSSLNKKEKKRLIHNEISKKSYYKRKEEKAKKSIEKLMKKKPNYSYKTSFLKTPDNNYINKEFLFNENPSDVDDNDCKFIDFAYIAEMESNEYDYQLDSKSSIKLYDEEDYSLDFNSSFFNFLD